MAMKHVGFAGLGAMGLGMASVLVEKQFEVVGFDVYAPSMEKFKSAGGKSGNSPKETAAGTEMFVVMVTNADQAEEVLFGKNGAVSALPDGATVMLCSTVPPNYVRTLETRLAGLERGLGLVDAPVSGGVVKAAEGKLTIMAAGTKEALERADPVLKALSENLYIIEGGAGSGSNIKMVNQLLAGVHIAAAAEAMALGAKAGLSTRVLYEIIKNAAGGSWMFVNRVPHMLDADFTPRSALDIFVKDLGIVLGEAKQFRFPLPLAAAAHQQFLFGSAAGFGRQDDAAVVKVFEALAGVKVAASRSADGGESAAEQQVAEIKAGPRPKQVGFIGLGAMGLGMATTLLKNEISVRGFDVWEPSMTKFRAAGGESCSSPAEAAKGADVLVIMVTNSDQAELVCFGPGGAVAELPDGAVVVLCSTVAPDYVRSLEKKLAGIGRGLLLVDAPVSGGVVKAAEGTLTIMAAGSEEALRKAGAVLSALSEKLYIIEGGAGAGSSVKMVNQHLAGVHIATSAEAMALGARAGLSTRQLYDIISNAAGSSWMFVNRVPHMLDGDYTPRSALDIFVKDLGIVLGEAKGLTMPLPLAAAAHQQFLAGSAAGLGREDDAAVVKVYERLTGVSVASPRGASEPQSGQGGAPLAAAAAAPALSAVQLPELDKDSTLAALGPEWAEDAGQEVREAEHGAKLMVVLDDDPTGTQTVHGVTVLTEWSAESVTAEMKKGNPCFFILTNSRALPTSEAETLTKEICSNVAAAAKAAGISGYTIILRGDSTLRGHFPEEADAAQSVVGETDAWLIAPFFLQGGRYTLNDVHYVATGDKLVPAGQTQFAKDAAFGYLSSNLREWVEEKTKGRIQAKDVASVSLDTIRGGGPGGVCKQLCGLPKGAVCIVNAASDGDMRVFAAGMLRAEAQGKRFLCRTAASFVSARLGIVPQEPLTPTSLNLPHGSAGGLIVVGSYVPMTTKQLEVLHEKLGASIASIVVSVAAVSGGDKTAREREITRVAATSEACLRSGTDTVVMTSRDLVTGNSPASSLAIGNQVSSALVEIVRRIRVRPRYLLAKGGITSSDIATKAMEARRAEVAGQAMPGVPLWRLGEGSRHPGVPYIVFPGNVGGPDALAHVVQLWGRQASATTKTILSLAKEGKYAVGAFNVYNLEGVKAVVAAAEAENSPAILQIHPSALGHGGEPLVACCVAAARSAKVPISVHLDHGTDEAQVMRALDMGFDSVMVDGSHLSYDDNVAFTRRVASAARTRGMLVEAELGRLSGSEDGITVEEYAAKLTDVAQAADFLKATGVDALAVCVGNVHGNYPPGPPKIDIARLKALREVADKHGAVIVLHGASGLPPDIVKESIDAGVRKFNVNTEVRSAYVGALADKKKDLLDYMALATMAMKEVVVDKLRMFRSSNKA